MKVLVVGSGGREHALAWKLSQSLKITELILAPGNDGAALEPNIRREKVSLGNDYADLLEFAKAEKVDFAVIGPDQALADGLVDKFAAIDIPSFGPSAAAARIESSKAFSKSLMEKANIPTARFVVFEDVKKARDFVENCEWSDGIVIKADGLALGKGVIVAESKAEALKAVDKFMLDGSMGDAGKKIVVEERLLGREVSAFYICDGDSGRLLSLACDYKQIYDGGKGPNTGGMGAFAPTGWLPEDYDSTLQSRVVTPLLQAMDAEGCPFKGVLFVGIMHTGSGPKILEFNARFGDPETQAIMPLMDSDLFPILYASMEGSLAKLPPTAIRLKPGAAVHVVMAAHGYPGTQEGVSVRKEDAITIEASLLPSSESSSQEKLFQEKLFQEKLFFAGVQSTEEGELETSGGRVLGLTVLAADLESARSGVYSKIREIHFAGAQIRTDIGL